MLNWILVPSHVEWATIALALATPVLALLAWGALLSRGRRDVRHSRGFWLAALAGPLVLVLWRVYNAIEDRFGLDSLAALGLNALIFLGLGLGVGLWLRGARSEDS